LGEAKKLVQARLAPLVRQLPGSEA
jgi:hypothetical protein